MFGWYVLGVQIASDQVFGSLGDHDFQVPGLLWGFVRSTPHPVTVTTRIITFLVGNPYKPSFATVTGWGVDPRDLYF